MFFFYLVYVYIKIRTLFIYFSFINVVRCSQRAHEIYPCTYITFWVSRAVRLQITWRAILFSMTPTACSPWASWIADEWKPLYPSQRRKKKKKKGKRKKPYRITFREIYLDCAVVAATRALGLFSVWSLDAGPNRRFTFQEMDDCGVRSKWPVVLDNSRSRWRCRCSLPSVTLCLRSAYVFHKTWWTDMKLTAQIGE